METNFEKQEIYKTMKIDLKKAMNSGFYYQAIFIEYAIVEDRCLSVLKHAGVKYKNDKGQEIKLSAKLNRIRSNPAFTNTFVRKRLSLDFIDEIESWKRNRDKLIHDLAKIPYDHESVREIAENGQDIIKRLDNAVQSVNNHNRAKDC